VLRAIEVKIPASLANGKETKIDLLNLFYGNKDTFINGVTNAAGTSEAETFFFYNVCPKLQVHGLTVNEKLAGARYRRHAITREGSAFLAEMERKLLLKDDAASLNATEQAVVDAKGESSHATNESTRNASKAPAKRSVRKNPGVT
jgi:hypothetical protein